MPPPRASTKSSNSWNKKAQHAVRHVVYSQHLLTTTSPRPKIQQFRRPRNSRALKCGCKNIKLENAQTATKTAEHTGGQQVRLIAANLIADVTMKCRENIPAKAVENAAAGAEHRRDHLDPLPNPRQKSCCQHLYRDTPDYHHAPVARETDNAC